MLSRIVLAIGLSALLPFHASLQAQERTAPTLRFADLEFSMPTDPLLWSSDPGWEAHHTPASLLTSATDTLRSAIPTGTRADDAEARLSKAGGRCTAVSAGTIECRCRDVETPYGGDYWDQVNWKVMMSVADGRVNDLSVSRDWTRR